MKIAVYILALLFIAGCEDKKIAEPDEGISLSKAMGEVRDSDFSKAYEKRNFVFPEDHGPHEEFRTEWWYFTGNLASGEGRQLGYQFTIFRTGLGKLKPGRESGWNSNQIYMAHFAVADVSGGKFYFDERFSREGNSLAGAQAAPLKVWLEDWRISDTGAGASFELPQIRITAGSDEFSIDLTLDAAKPFVLQGDSGLSRKGAAPGNASYYYSYTRLATSGSVNISGKTHMVSGDSWMDREWSTSALSSDQTGWDWFALQLSDSTEIMYYQMRKTDGSADVFSKGIYVDKNGASVLLKKESVILEVTGNWTSERGTTYPSGWKMRIPEKDIELEVTPAMEDQLLDVSVKYWEGSVKIDGRSNGRIVSGRGYVELTGY